MKIVHTSDWHLGQRFLGESREDEHRAFLDWLLELIEKRGIDVLIVAGDIFDTATPPSYARKLYNDFLAKVAKSNCSNIVIIGGNHDSPVVLNEEQNLLKELNIYVVGGFEEDIDKLIIPIKNRDGELQGVIGAIAYLRESSLRDSSKSTDAQDRAVELEKAIASYYQEVYSRCINLVANKSLPVVATGHLSTLKVLESESVRDIYIGSLEIFNKELFPQFDYIALGHYHKFTKMKNICYCGSPITLSFDEVGDKKVVLDVNIEKSDFNITEIEVPVFRRLHRVSGRVEQIREELEAISITSAITPEWVELEITPDGIESLSIAIEELRAINRDLKIIKNILKSSAKVATLSELESEASRLENLTPDTVFERVLELQEDWSQEDKRRVLQIFYETIEKLDEDTEA